MPKVYKPVVLVILDGFGVWREQRGNPTYLASLPHLTEISRFYPGVALNASGIDVGLNWGEVGSSEVGHYNIGSGLVTYQNLPRIQFALKDGSFFKLKIWDELIQHAEKNNGKIHLMGLLSNGGIHAHIDHLLTVLELLKQRGVRQPILVHVFTDGQDAPPGSAKQFIEILENKIKELGIGKIATVTGRHYALDKSENWELTERTYDCLVNAKGAVIHSPLEAMAENDEFVKPSVVVDANNQPVGKIDKGDAIFFFNFRADRARQLTQLFINKKLENLFLGTMTEYQKDYPAKVAMPAAPIKYPMTKVISQAGKKQFHIAETEKYAHITYFLNSGVETPFLGEDRAIIPSPKVDSYDIQPEMSAYQITERVLEELKNKKYDFIAINFANPDLVAHTGNIEAAAHALTVVDNCIGKIVPATITQEGAVVITADHGNVEEMLTLATGKVDTEHSTNFVPCWIVTPDNKMGRNNVKTEALPEITPSGILADIAPTVLELMDLPPAPEMTGRSLVQSIDTLVLK